jgi:hypothetical protein
MFLFIFLARATGQQLAQALLFHAPLALRLPMGAMRAGLTLSGWHSERVARLSQFDRDLHHSMLDADDLAQRKVFFFRFR